MTDRQTVQIVILGLISFALLGLIGIVALVASHHPPGDVSPIVALVGPAIGAVGAVLVSTRSADPDQIADQAKQEQALGLAQLALPEQAEQALQAVGPQGPAIGQPPAGMPPPQG